MIEISKDAESPFPEFYPSNVAEQPAEHNIDNQQVYRVSPEDAKNGASCMQAFV